MAKNLRPSWDEYFLSIAELVSKRSTCLRRRVGAVLVKDKRILATGYNGAPSSIEHCDKTGCIREKLKVPSGERHELCRGLHAEQNAFLQAALHGTSLKDSTLYCTTQPCVICAKMIINAGIKEIAIKGDYPDKMSKRLLREAKIKVRMLGAALVFLAFCQSTSADGLDALIAVGKSQGEIARSHAQETRNYESVKAAIERGALKKGMPKDSIRKLYGDPVIEFNDANAGKEKWVYKDAAGTFFDGMKIYLIFDAAGNLEDTQIVEKKERRKEVTSI